MSNVTACLLKHFGAKSPIEAYREDMAGDAKELIAAGMDADAAWKQVTQAKLAELRAEHARITGAVSDAYAKTAAGKMARAGKADEATTAPAATHQDPGEQSEPATAPVVSESLQKAAKSEDRKPSEMRAELLAKIDVAMASAKDADDQDVQRYDERGRAKPDRTVLMRRYGRSGRQLDSAIAEVQRKIDAERATAAENIGFVTFDVPGDGEFKVINTKARLIEFRRKVESSPGFKNTTKPIQSERVNGYGMKKEAGSPFGVESGSGGPKAVIQNMIDEGDAQAAVDYAASKGVEIADTLKGDKDRLEKIVGLTPTAEQQEQPEAEPAKKPAAKSDEPSETATSETAPAKPARPRNPETVENFGEELPPSRRKLAASLQKDFSDEQLANTPLSQIWPLAENDAIEDTFAAAVATAARAEIPAKPRVGYKLKRWIEQVKTVRTLAQFIVSGKLTKDEFIAKAKTHALRGFMSKVALLESIDRANWSRIGQVQEAPDAYEYKDGKKIPSPMVSVTIDGKHHWMRGGGSVADHIDAINMLLGYTKPGKRMEFEVRGSGTSYFINKKGDSEYRRLKTFETAEEASKYRRENYGDLVAAWEAVKERDNVTERDLRSGLNKDRIGPDYRNGKDITGEEFDSTFGFKGGEFGRWVSQGKGKQERQWMLNSAYDALMDLAGIVGIPPRAISLNGTLGIAFGSRGAGWASAHFEPGNLVINLTKTRGAGALAHEWFHALDNYFARSRGGEVAFKGDQKHYRDNNYITHKPEPLMVRKDGRGTPVSKARLESMRAANPTSGYLSADQWQVDPKHPAGVRPEVEQRFVDLVQALNDAPMTKRAALIDKGTGYWSQLLERAARSFESYVINRMMMSGQSNEYLANVTKIEDFARDKERYPYPTPAEIQPVADAFDALFSELKTRTDDAGNVALYSRAQGAGGNTRAEVRRAREAHARIVANNGVASADDLRDMLRVPGYSQWAESALVGNVDSSAALRRELADAFPGTNWQHPILNAQGVITFYGLGDNREQALATLTAIADRHGAPIAVRGHAQSYAQDLRDAGFIGYSGMQEVAGRPRDAMIQWIRPAGGIGENTPLFSLARTGHATADNNSGSTTPAALRERLTAEFGADVIGALETAGLLRIADAPSDSMPSDVAGVTEGERIGLFADNTAPGSTAVAYHEALHATLRASIGDAAYDALMARMPTLASGNKEFFAEANKRIPANTPASVRAEEQASYAVEAYQKNREAMPAGVRKWAADFIAAFKAGLAKALQAAGVGLKLRVTLLSDAAVLHKLARDGLRAMAREAGQDARRGLAPAFSVAPKTDSAAFRKWFGDSKVVDAQSRPLVSRPALVAARKAASLEGGVNGGASNAKPISDLLIGQPFSLQGLGGLEIPAQRKVLDGVLSLGDDLKILRSVVELIPIDVVDILAGKNLSAEELFRDEAVLKKLLSADRNGSVSTAVDIADALVLAVARMAAKGSAVPSNPFVGSKEVNATAGTGDADVFHVGIVNQTIGNSGDFDATNPDIRYSIASAVLGLGGGAKIIGQTSRKYTPEQQHSMRSVGFEFDKPTLEQRVKEMWKDAGKKLAQGLVDQFAPIRDISEHAYGLMRLSKGASGALQTMLHGGMLKLTDGVYDFDDANRGGVIETLFKPLQGEHHDFLRWVAANRAERLASEGKENLFSDEDIDNLKSLADGETDFDYTIQHGARAGQTTRDRLTIYEDSLKTFNGFNKNVLDMAEQSGLIDGESRAVWEHEFYVPFYRVADEDGGVRGMSVKGSAVRQEAFKTLKGGRNALNNDLLDNTLMNWAHLLDASAKNRAASATLQAAESVGAAISSTESAVRDMGAALQKKNGVVWVMEDGVKRYYLIDDPHLVTALTALEYAGMRGPMMDAMSSFKRALTIGVTASPFFKIRNLIRDSVQAIGTGKLGYNPLSNVGKGWALTDPKSDAYFRLLAGGGTIHFGTMMEGNESKRVQALIESGVDKSTILSDEHAVKAFYRRFIEPGVTAYNELGNRGEAINRASLYAQLRSQGVGHAQASLQARDLMDFSMQGSFASVRFLTQVVPFFNARIQGLYKLGRSAKEDPARMGIVLGATAMASLALLLAYHDDEDWKKREDWDRNNFWWFKFGGTAFRIPKPFEIGAVATLAERGFELAFSKEMTGKRFGQNLLHLLGDNLSMNPVPQLFKPMLDVYANKDSFTGRPIETMGMERLRPEYRFNGRTSMFARGVSTAANSITNTVGIDAPSPVQIDQMLRGYFGWLGTFIVGSADIIARPASGQVSQPLPDILRTATGNMVSDLRDAPNRYVSQMYDQARELEEVYGTWRALLKAGKSDEAAEFRADNQDALNRYRFVERVKSDVSKINQRIRAIEQSDAGAMEKRLRIREANVQKDLLARRLELH